MKFKIKTKAGEIVDSNRLNLMINPANGMLYQRGSNVDHLYTKELVTDDLTADDEIRAKIEILKNYSEFADLLIEKMPELTCSQLKCFIVIMYETMAKSRTFTEIRNKTFMERCKKGVSRRDVVNKATNYLLKNDYIEKRESDKDIFMYSVKNDSRTTFMADSKKFSKKANLDKSEYE